MLIIPAAAMINMAFPHIKQWWASFCFAHGNLKGSNSETQAVRTGDLIWKERTVL